MQSYALNIKWCISSIILRLRDCFLDVIYEKSAPDLDALLIFLKKYIRFRESILRILLIKVN